MSTLPELFAHNRRWAAGVEERPLGLVDNWLQSVRDVAHLYREQLLELPTDAARRRPRYARRRAARPVKAARPACRISIATE